MFSTNIQGHVSSPPPSLRHSHGSGGVPFSKFPFLVIILFAYLIFMNNDPHSVLWIATLFPYYE